MGGEEGRKEAKERSEGEKRRREAKERRGGKPSTLYESNERTFTACEARARDRKETIF